MMLSRLPAILSLAGVASILSTGTAHAYLDPGTASLILQGIVGAIGAGIVTMGFYWRKVTGFLGRKSDGSGLDTPTADRKRH